MRPIESVEQLIFHHSASSLGTTIDQIRAWHVDGNGWDDVGYHWVIESRGAIKPARGQQWEGAHARGSNGVSLGVCLVGDNYDEENRWTHAQWRAARDLVANVTRVYPDVHILGHRDVSSGTGCPGVDVGQWLARFWR